MALCASHVTQSTSHAVSAPHFLICTAEQNSAHPGLQVCGVEWDDIPALGAGWHMPVVPALGRVSQGDLEFEATRGYSDLVSKNKQGWGCSSVGRVLSQPSRGGFPP